MKHFEITYLILNHGFVYKCTTAYEAIEALASLQQVDDIIKHYDLDKLMEKLVLMKNEELLKYESGKLRIKYVDGEI